ncbi:MAG: hypothetical protein WCW03_02370 [Candidatus Paceibacterota bacterium]|jgi:hypothetical protein
MSEKSESLYELVPHKGDSPLRVELNKGVARLQSAQNTQFRPHVCLNGEDGIKVIQRIVADPEKANTAYWLNDCFIVSGDDVWLNTRLSIFLDSIGSSNHVLLSPQQTGYIVGNLREESKRIVVEKVKTWFIGKVLPGVQKGLDTIKEQFEKGDPLIASDHRNRIFDIHGGCSMEDIPYTETVVAGEELFWSVVHGNSLYSYGCDGYNNADEVITGRRNEQRAAVGEFLGAFRAIRR